MDDIKKYIFATAMVGMVCKIAWVVGLLGTAVNLIWGLVKDVPLVSWWVPGSILIVALVLNIVGIFLAWYLYSRMMD